MTEYFDENVEIQGNQDVTQLLVQGHTSQSQPLQEWQNSAGDPLARVTNDGRVQLGDFDPLEQGAMATDDALLEVSRSETSGRPKRGLHVLGRIGGVLTDAVVWAVHELELIGSSPVSGPKTAMRTRLTNRNTGDNSQTQLRAAEIETVNEAGSVSFPVGQATGARISITNSVSGVLNEAIGVDVELNQDSGGVINSAYGLRINDIEQGSSNNYALHTNQGKVHLGDVVEFTKPNLTPDSPEVNHILVYPTSDGKLYSKNWNDEEVNLTVAMINDLVDVDTHTAPPSDGQALVWSDSAGLWVPDTLAGGPGSGGDASTVSYTPIDNTHWNSEVDPGNVDDALNQLADRVKLTKSD
jgi:hypothetical protein